MYIINGIAYAGEFSREIEVENVSVLDDLMMLIKFNNGEKRLFDASSLLEYPAYKPLENDETFKSATVDRGVLVWLNGDIDIATQTLYENSFAYEESIA